MRNLVAYFNGEMKLKKSKTSQNFLLDISFMRITQMKQQAKTAEYIAQKDWSFWNNFAPKMVKGKGQKQSRTQNGSLGYH